MTEGRTGSTTGARGPGAVDARGWQGDGRRNQKMRTRRALIDAAAALIREGRSITISEVAERAQVSVATAYRYFSTPQDLVVETRTVVRGPEFLADLPADPAERLDTVVSRTADAQLGDEALWRTLLKTSMERWFEQRAAGTDEPDGQHPIRSRSRLDLTRTALEPLADTLPPELHRRLTMAVTLVYGVEAVISARDVCELDPEEAKDVMRWAAGALLEQAVRDAPDVPDA
ncbi:TetR/AcrR family transcriptional regulator [Streptomyces sp. NPDC087263]|uniref:TetR/AcrR family transcriptional regulator n=1 Tax=Streptomyces sp. NPDC087263 TaxID=3365773 RepID=UPI00382488C3